MKKGFTVVELLAIIIILAVISLITYTVIQRNIDVTRKSSFEISVKHVIDAAKEYVVTNYEDNDFPEGGIDINNHELDIKNDEFISGVIIKNDEGAIEVVDLTDGKLCANGTKNDLAITDYVDCVAKDETPPTLEVKVLKKTSSKVRFLVKMQDAQSGLSNLTYCSGSCDKVETLELPDKRGMVKKVIEISNLKSGKKYKFKFTVKNNLESDNEEYTTTSIEKEVELPEVEEPTFKISSGSHATTKHVKIIYPELSEYEYSYYTGGNSENIKVLESGKYEADFDISENTRITARISKDGNIVIESSLNVAGIDLEPPTTYVYIENRGTWTLEKKVYVKSVDDSSGLALRGYSLNNKKNWVKANNNGVVTTLKANQIFTLKTRDKVGNINENFRLCEDRDFENCGEETDSVIINRIDNVAPRIEFTVIEGSKAIDSNPWYISSSVKVRVTITDQVKEVDNNGNEKTIDGGRGFTNQEPEISVIYENFGDTQYTENNPSYTLVSSNNITRVYDMVIENFKYEYYCSSMNTQDKIDHCIARKKQKYKSVNSNGTNKITVDMVDELNNSTRDQNKTGKFTVKKDDVIPKMTLKNSGQFSNAPIQTKTMYTVTAGASGYTITCNPETLQKLKGAIATCNVVTGSGREVSSTDSFIYTYSAKCTKYDVEICTCCGQFKNTSQSNDHSGDSVTCNGTGCTPDSYNCLSTGIVQECSYSCDKGGTKISNKVCGIYP